MNDAAERVYDAYCNLEDADRRAVLSRIKQDQAFTRNLNAIADIISEHGPEAGLCAMKGDLEGAKKAALEHRKKHPKK